MREGISLMRGRKKALFILASFYLHACACCCAVELGEIAKANGVYITYFDAYVAEVHRSAEQSRTIRNQMSELNELKIEIRKLVKGNKLSVESQSGLSFGRFDELAIKEPSSPEAKFISFDYDHKKQTFLFCGFVHYSSVGTTPKIMQTGLNREGKIERRDILKEVLVGRGGFKEQMQGKIRWSNPNKGYVRGVDEIKFKREVLANTNYELTWAHVPYTHNDSVLSESLNKIDGFLECTAVVDKSGEFSYDEKITPF